MAMQVCRHRGGLARTARALAAGELTIGFLGGSITEEAPRHNWPEVVAGWFADRYPQTRISVSNAALGATTSELAALRAERDIIAHGCELVFVEYAVNDYYASPESRQRTREGLLRKLLAAEGRDIVIVYTFRQEMYDGMIRGEVPPSIAEFETLAEHYGIGSVWMGLHALREVQRGLMRWEEWLPDQLHPGSRGSYSYASSVVGFLERELAPGLPPEPIPAGERLPAPLNGRNWEQAKLLALTDVRREGPWILRKSHHYGWMRECLETPAIGAGLSVSFNGRGIVLGMAFGLNSADFRWRIDGGEWQLAALDRHDWVPDLDSWLRVRAVAEELAPGSHLFELQTVHGNTPKHRGTNFRLALVGVLP